MHIYIYIYIHNLLFPAACAPSQQSAPWVARFGRSFSLQTAVFCWLKGVYLPWWVQNGWFTQTAQYGCVPKIQGSLWSPGNSCMLGKTWNFFVSELDEAALVEKTGGEEQGVSFLQAWVFDHLGWSVDFMLFRCFPSMGWYCWWEKQPSWDSGTRAQRWKQHCQLSKKRGPSFFGFVCWVF